MRRSGGCCHGNEAYGAFAGGSNVGSVTMATGPMGPIGPMGAEVKWGRLHGNEAYGVYRAYGAYGG